ncbi:tRNA (adenosine(37)-N6)-threonylcarbamoyltransferase complex dimerization subunit type 1 TsaB [Xenophilus sp. AP218F]|nr:tRNA (adenosine(37)-N6)-threonylcarbamoyltransferase complex dimerization subunit type 1 TsaB [Xenophilus sp. AP218F]
MKLLALDTSTHYLSLALSDGDKVSVFHENVDQKHAEQTLPQVSRLLAARGMRLADLDAIVFGQGPGSFTGLRIACGLAQGLAYSAGLPVIAIPTIDNVAHQAGADNVLVCLDARMRQVYTAAYQTGPEWRRLSAIEVCDPDQVALPADIDVAAGDGFASYPALLAGQRPQLMVLDQLRPHASAYLALARSGRYPATHPREAELLYIRNKVALTSIEQQQARQS